MGILLSIGGDMRIAPVDYLRDNVCCPLHKMSVVRKRVSLLLRRDSLDQTTKVVERNSLRVKSHLVILVSEGILSSRKLTIWVGKPIVKAREQNSVVLRSSGRERNKLHS